MSKYIVSLDRGYDVVYYERFTCVERNAGHRCYTCIKRNNHKKCLKFLGTATGANNVEVDVEGSRYRYCEYASGISRLKFKRITELQWALLTLL